MQSPSTTPSAAPAASAAKAASSPPLQPQRQPSQQPPPPSPSQKSVRPPPPPAFGVAAPLPRPHLSPSTEAVITSMRKELTAQGEWPFFMTPHSLVYRTYSSRFGRAVAVKIIDKRAIPAPVVEKFVPREMEITAKARHPHLARALSLLNAGPERTVIVSEWYEGGNLLERLQRQGPLREVPEAARLFRQLIEAVVHRDIKLENILIDSNHDIHLSDFGFSRPCPRRQRSTSFCGTPFYSSPQLGNKKPYDPYASDWFACGVVLYTLIVGHWPKFDPDLQFPEEGKPPSAACRRLIQKLLIEDEWQRAGYDECRHSEWMGATKWIFADASFVYTAIQ